MAGAGFRLSVRGLLAPGIVIAGSVAYGLVNDGRGGIALLAYVLLLLLMATVAIPLGMVAVTAAWRRERSSAASWCVAALLLADLPPVAGYLMTWPRDQLRLFVWSVWDGEALAQPGIVGEWDAWGIAGMTNLSFLVVEPDDALTLERADARWGDELCDIVGARRLRAGIFIVTTMNCALR